ncbi:meiosis-specific nuclear structural protein 1-like [Anopheles bellator]|uniref:meiosis-specific nuclear structural protein 1-like n=1 Tax=Anopheles bellator TaxID=139047 RepID=UPI002647FE9D|nr:meiosis-specific nuclear structural protein 1-like [Anopheles bellator]
MFSAAQKQRQLKQTALCRDVESKQVSENYHKDLSLIQRNSIDRWRKQKVEEQSRQRDAKQAELKQHQEAERRYRLQEEQEKAQQLLEAERRKINEEKLRQQLRESNQEIRELESKLRAAYVAKGITAQLAEIEQRKQHDKLQACREKEACKKQQQENLVYMQSKHEAETKQKKQLRTVLLEQISESRYKKQCLYEDFLRQKSSLDAVVKKIQEEHLEAIQRKLELRNCTRKEMEYFQESKETWKARQKLLNDEENELIRKYCKEKDELYAEVQKRKEEMNAKREHLNMRMVAEMESAEAEKLKRENLLQELYMAEQDDRVKLKLQRELEDSLRKRIDLRVALEQQKSKNTCQRELEAEMDKRFQEDQIKAWAERDRIEQMSNERRRRKMIEYRREVLDLLEDRRQRRVSEVNHILQLEDEQRQEDELLQKILEEERIKLLREHMTALLGFLPPGVLRESDREFIPLPKAGGTQKHS